MSVIVTTIFRQDRARGRQHSDIKERASIIALTQAGKSINEIARLLGIGRATVVLWQQRHQEIGDVERKRGSSGKLKTTADEDRRIFQTVLAKPITAAKEIFRNICPCKL